MAGNMVELKKTTATEILKTVHILSSYLGCKIYVNHIHRVSNEMADLADELTRKSMSENAESRKCLEKAEFRQVCSTVMDYFMHKNVSPLYKMLLKNIDIKTYITLFCLKNLIKPLNFTSYQ